MSLEAAVSLTDYSPARLLSLPHFTSLAGTYSPSEEWKASAVYLDRQAVLRVAAYGNQTRTLSETIQPRAQEDHTRQPARFMAIAEAPWLCAPGVAEYGAYCFACFSEEDDQLPEPDNRMNRISYTRREILAHLAWHEEEEERENSE